MRSCWQHIVPLTLAALALALGTAPAAGQAVFDSMNTRDIRYCEVLLYYPIEGDPDNVQAFAYNTIGIDDCPPEDWATVVANLDSYVEQYGAVAGELNGPRFFTYDGVATPGGDTNPGLNASFGPIDMEADGVFTTPLAEVEDNTTDYYGISQVKRMTNYTYNAGGHVYQLTSGTGDTYWMQSYSTQLYPLNTSVLQDAAAMTALLTDLPAGWQYDTFVLPEDGMLIANGTAYVVTDQLLNTWQRTNEPYQRP